MSDGKPIEYYKCPRCQKFYSNQELDQALILNCCDVFCRACVIKMKKDTEILCPIDYKTMTVRYVSDLTVDQDRIDGAIRTNGQQKRATIMSIDVAESLTQALVPANLEFLNASELNLDKQIFKCIKLMINDSVRRVFTLKETFLPANKTSDKTIKVIDLFDEQDKVSGMESWKFAIKTLIVDGTTLQLLGIAEVLSLPQEPPAPKIQVLPNHFKRSESDASVSLTNLKFSAITANFNEGTGKIVILV